MFNVEPSISHVVRYNTFYFKETVRIWGYLTRPYEFWMSSRWCSL